MKKRVKKINKEFFIHAFYVNFSTKDIYVKNILRKNLKQTIIEKLS
jgi:hypothetical protein